MGAERRNVQPHEADESVARPKLCRIHAKSVLAKVRFQLRHQRITLSAGETSREELHHLRISVDSRKMFLVRLSPFTKDQARGLYHYCSLHDIAQPAGYLRAPAEYFLVCFVLELKTSKVPSL